MKALIDGDILLYSIGSATNDEGHPLSWPLTLARLDGKIHQIVREAGADDYIIYITGEGNFRHDEATIKPYKGNRNQPKPHHYDRIKKYFSNTTNHKVEFVNGYEADDAMAIEQYKDLERYLKNTYEYATTYEARARTIICSRDKDLRMVPGWHYEWHDNSKKKKDPYYVSEAEGFNWFFQQLLMGDTVDNILGLYGVGPTHAKRFLKDADDIDKMYSIVREQYEKRFGSYWRMFMNENARLLWMLREPDDDVRVRIDIWEHRKQLKEKEEINKDEY